MKEISKLITVTILCSCGKEINLNYSDGVASQVSFDANEAECELCGSHGSISMSYICPKCKKNKEIILHSW